MTYTLPAEEMTDDYGFEDIDDYGFEGEDDYHDYGFEDEDDGLEDDGFEGEDYGFEDDGFEGEDYGFEDEDGGLEDDGFEDRWGRRRRRRRRPGAAARRKAAMIRRARRRRDARRRRHPMRRRPTGPPAAKNQVKAGFRQVGDHVQDVDLKATARTSALARQARAGEWAFAAGQIGEQVKSTGIIDGISNPVANSLVGGAVTALPMMLLKPAPGRSVFSDPRLVTGGLIAGIAGLGAFLKNRAQEAAEKSQADANAAADARNAEITTAITEITERLAALETADG